MFFPQSNSSSSDSFALLSIDPNASFVIETEAATSSVMVGWADVRTSGPLIGYGIFRQRTAGLPDSEGTVLLDTQPSSTFKVPYDNTSGFQTGIALANQSSVTVMISVTIRDDKGNALVSSQISLPGLGHTSFFLSNNFAQTADGRGTVEFGNSSAINITGIGLRFSPTLSFTSLPMMR